MPRTPPTLAVLGACLGLLGACAREGRGPLPFTPAATAAPSGEAAPAPGAALRDRAEVATACREAADRVILTRDRGQLMREDERDARIGTDASIYARRVETDRLGRIYERDQLARSCVAQNARGGSAVGAAPAR